MPHGQNYYSARYQPQFAIPFPRTGPKVAEYGHSGHTFHATPHQFPRAAYDIRIPTAPFFEYNYVRPSRASRQRRNSDATPPERSRYEANRRLSQSAPYDYTNDYGYDDIYDEAPTSPYKQYARRNEWDADPYYYDQVPFYDELRKARRPRRASGTARAQPTTPKKHAAAAKPTNKPTEEDARRAGIPAGYSYKNWDPSEEPIMLLGSVFDANSLGKWIYDWTVFYNGPATPLAEMAGELWLLLIQLAGKVKRAEEALPKMRKKESHEMVEDFLESGERLWIRFVKLLKVCEDYMWKAAKKENGDKNPVSMSSNSGREFVDSIFGRDRELEKTEKLMTGMRLWSMRFDANCDDVLRHPTT
jgi:hypothetical protein